MLPNEARYLYDWTRTSRISYGDFLRAKQFEGSIRFAIDAQTKELVATSQQLSDRGLEVISESLERGFAIVSADLQDVSAAVRQGTDEIVSALNWGFSEILASLGQMGIQLADLVRLTRTPSQTWACEQFEIARDEMRRQLYAEALQSVTRAIEGFGSNSGIQTEFRFHFLLGTIRLGSYKNSSSDTIDPRLAEQAFLAAARYARADYPNDAGQAFICAARAAFIQNSLDRAIAHSENGLALAPNHCEGRYQLGRTLFLTGLLERAQGFIADAIVLDSEYALRAIADPDFVSNPPFLQHVLDDASVRHKTRYNQARRYFTTAQKALEAFTFGGVRTDTLQLSSLAMTRNAAAEAETYAHTATLLGFDSATKHLLSAYRYFPTQFEEYKSRFAAHHREQLSSHRSPPTISRSDDFGGPFGVGVASALLTFIVMAYRGCSDLQNTQRFPQYHGKNLISVQWDYAVGPALILAAIMGIVVVLGGYMYLRASRAQNAEMWETHRQWTQTMQAEMLNVHSLTLPQECHPPDCHVAAQETVPGDARAKRARP